MRSNRILGSLVAFVLAVGPFGMATAEAQTAPSATTAPAVAPATTASVTGTARDSSGSPLGRATITLTGPTTASTVSDDNGRYAFDGVAPGVYTISATKSGYTPASTNDVNVIVGTSTSLDVTLATESLSSLRTIASTRTGSARSGFNTSGLSITTLSGSEIQARLQPNLDEEIGELPGVVSSMGSGGRTPNSSFVVRGLLLETKTTIDGHVLTNGTFGNYFSQYASSLIFNQAEVLKGAGLNGVNAGESGVGTVNLRTRDFTSKDSAQVQYGSDSFGSQFYQALLDVNLLKNNKLSLLGASVLQGNLGPDYQYMAGNLNTLGQPRNTGAANQDVPLGNALNQWVGDFSNTFSTRAQLLKARYRFSDATALTLQFLGLQGLYSPQGGSYGYNYGLFTIQQCANKAGNAVTFATGAACTASSTYTNPAYFNQVGTNVPLYSYFPNSAIRNNEPLFSGEFRTSYKNDTFLLRPYTAIVNRFIDGTREPTTPGYGTNSQGNGWYQVTNAANCTSQFAYGKTPGGAANQDGSSSGPCYTTQNVSSAYIGTTVPTFPVVYKTTGTAPACSVATPCYTTPTNVAQNGQVGYQTPFSTPEEDRLHGATFQYLHPVHDNLYTLSADFNNDDTQSFTGDTSPLPPGCNGTVSGGSNAQTIKGVVNPYYQAACAINGTVLPNLPRSSISIPSTQDRRFDYSATALLQATPKLQIGLGAYYEQQRFYYQFTDPNAVLAATNAGNPGAEPANLTFLKGYSFKHHFDPHVQLEFRPTSNLSIRANGGSSVTFPYAAQVSGFSTLNINGGAGGTTDTLNQKNPDLRPETFVGYDLGADYRLADGSVVSVDGFDDTIHDVFVQSTFQLATPTFALPPGFNEQVSTTQNVAEERSYGLEGTIQKNPAAGFGYRLDGALNRVYYAGIPYSFYPAYAAGQAPSFSPLINNKQLDGAGGGTQIPYFKARAQISYAPDSGKYQLLLGDAFEGNNNPTGGPPYFNAYASYRVDLAPHLSFQASGQNIFNYSTGSQLGQAVAYAGFNPTGIAQGPGGSFVYGNAFSTPNSIEVVQPRTIYFSLTAKY